MHKIQDIPAWDRLLKRIVWQQIGDLSNQKILDFGSGQGITANHFAQNNQVIAIEPNQEMLNDAWNDFPYEQIIGDQSILKQFSDNTFDFIICHNVLEYIEDKKQVIDELTRILKNDGTISIVKHNRYGRVFQMAVLLDDLPKAVALLNGENSNANKYGEIKYYNDEDIIHWNNKLKPIASYGIRTFFDLQQNQEKHSLEEWQTKMMEIEMMVSNINEFKNVAFFHHIIFKK